MGQRLAVGDITTYGGTVERTDGGDSGGQKWCCRESVGLAAAQVRQCSVQEQAPRGRGQDSRQPSEWHCNKGQRSGGHGAATSLGGKESALLMKSRLCSGQFRLPGHAQSLGAVAAEKGIGADARGRPWPNILKACC